MPACRRLLFSCRSCIESKQYSNFTAPQVSRAERAAENVIQDLREISGAPGTVQMRSNAASVLASLRQQRKQLEKAVWRVASRDI